MGHLFSGGKTTTLMPALSPWCNLDCISSYPLSPSSSFYFCLMLSGVKKGPWFIDWGWFSSSSPTVGLWVCSFLLIMHRVYVILHHYSMKVCIDFMDEKGPLSSNVASVSGWCDDLLLHHELLLWFSPVFFPLFFTDFSPFSWWGVSPPLFTQGVGKRVTTTHDFHGAGAIHAGAVCLGVPYRFRW